MSKPTQKAKWALPDVVDPPKRICFQVEVPDNKYHIAAFLGAMQGLASAVNWQDDPTHKARLVARVWRKIVDNLKRKNCADLTITGELEDDGMKLRIDPDNSCIIQCLDECSGEWGTFLDVSQCAPGAVAQQPPGGTPGVGTTSCYDIVIQGNSQWIAPIPVEDGDTIEISNVSGGWFDGAAWYCPSGLSYALGLCTGSPVFSGSDPNPAIAHARLIGTIDGGSSWNDAYNTTFPIPPGAAATDFILQMNDPSLSDNGGSITCRVCITHQAPSGWTYDVDFTTQSGGWVPYQNVTDNAHWILGTGWSSGAPGVTPEAMYIMFVALHDCVLTDLEATVNVSSTHQSYQGAALDRNGTDLHRDNSLAETPGGTIVFTGSQIVSTGDTLDVLWNVSGSPLGTAVCVSVHAEGTGTNPFV